MNTQVRCDCCGLMVRLTDGDDCPRCGYPVAQEKEERFLAENLRNLHRVATHGGASITVTTLITRYQQRQNYLWGLRTQQTTPQATPSMPVQQQGSPTNTFPAAESFGTGTPQPVVSGAGLSTPAPAVPEKGSVRLPEQLPVAQGPVQPSWPVPPVAAMPPVVSPKATRTFSFKTFLADQTINIVSSLGAFLILIGSLSFIVSTPDRYLSFFTLLVVHALFGIMGAITRQFKSFRVVSIIYTAIFALQVPLVGLAGYWLVSETQLSPAGLVAIAAMYAALVYGALAIYQQFQPFAYLAAISLTVADIALGISFHLAYWWWPSTLMVVAMASLVCVSHATGEAPSAPKPWDILFQPVRVVMKGYVYISYAYVGLSGLMMLTPSVSSQWSLETRFAIAFTLLLLLCWTCLFVWRSHLSGWLLTGPYLFAACTLAFAYAFSASASGYILVWTGIALLYHCTERLAQKSIQRVKTLRGHMEFLVIASLCVIPLIANAMLPFQVLDREHGFSLQSMTLENFIAIVALLCGIVLTGSLITSHTGWQKSPSQETRPWCWLLLLSGVLFYWIYNIVGLMFPIDPVWSALAFTYILLLASTGARRFASAAWANPLDILTLISAGQTLLLGFPHGQILLLALLLAFTGVTYAMALYQRRVYLFVLTFIFALMACIPMVSSGNEQNIVPTVLLLLCIFLPLVWAILERFLPLAQRPNGDSHVFFGSLWTCPVLIIGSLYTLEFLGTEAYHPVSTLGLWLHMPRFPIALEMALLACLWYSTAVVARKKIGLVGASGLACLALLFPGQAQGTVPTLTVVAFGGMLMAVAISRFADRDWGIPLYIVGLLAAFMLAGSGQLQFLSWACLGFGAFIYLISMMEREPVLAIGLRWLAVVFATCSLYDAGLLSEYAWAPIIAALGAAIGLGIRMIMPRVATTFEDKKKLWSYAGPLYTISLIAAILMGLDGLLLGITQPFYGAIPFALLAYAVIVYGVLVLEKLPQALFLTAVFAIWGLVLMVEMPVAYCIAVGLVMGVVGLGCSRILIPIGVQNGNVGRSGPLQELHAHEGRAGQGQALSLQWNWPWYLTFLIAAAIIGSWNVIALNKADNVLLEIGLALFLGLAFVLMLAERLPDVSLLVIGLAVRLIAQTGWDAWLMTCAYSLLCLLVFAQQWIWKRLPPALEIIPSIWLARVVSFSGLGIVILSVIAQGGLSSQAGLLAQSGIFAVCIGAILLLWMGTMESSTNRMSRYVCYYGAGLLLSLTIPWEMLAFGYTDVTWLTLAPASYMIVISPLFLHDKQWAEKRWIGHSLALGGAALLLLPTLWSSFDRAEVFPTFLLAAESLALLVLGTVVRIRFFVLSGAALVVVSAIHLIFLPALGIPTFLALTLAGMLLLALATVLLVIRTRLAAVWSELN